SCGRVQYRRPLRTRTPRHRTHGPLWLFGARLVYGGGTGKHRCPWHSLTRQRALYSRRCRRRPLWGIAEWDDTTTQVAGNEGFVRETLPLGAQLAAVSHSPGWPTRYRGRTAFRSIEPVRLRHPPH